LSYRETCLKKKEIEYPYSIISRFYLKYTSLFSQDCRTVPFEIMWVI